jgi:hypothetical protein
MKPQSKRTGTLDSQVSRGVVLIITMLALILLASLIMFVLNLGRQVNYKIVTQNAADSSAAAGSGYVARQLNTVAMNNVAMAQLIAGVNVLDSIPLAVDFSIKDDQELILGDETAMYLAVVHQLKTSMNGDPGNIFQRELTRTRDEIGAPEQQQPDSDEKVLSELNDLFKFDNPNLVMEQTFYESPTGGMGTMWQAMVEADQYNQVIMDQLGRLAQVNAIRGGQVNLVSKKSRVSSFMAPVVPQVPWIRGQFQDFERPVRFGQLPDATDDIVTNRGPYDSVFGWRNYDRGSSGGSYTGNPPGYRPPRPANENGYRTYGPHDWLLGHYENTLYGRLPWHLRNIATIKMSYLWPTKRNEADPYSLMVLVDPDWEIDIETDDERSSYPGLKGFEGGDPDDQRRMLDDTGQNEVPLSDGDADGDVNTTVYEFADGQRDAIHETLFMVLDLYHRDQGTAFPDSQRYPDVQPPNSTWYIQERRIQPRYLPRMSRQNFLRNSANRQPTRGWTDPVPGPPGGRMRSNIQGETSVYTQITSGRYAWKETVGYETNPLVEQGKYRNGGYPELGINPIQTGVDADGEPLYAAQKYYRTRFFLLVGVNVGLEKVIRDPYTGFNPDSASAPAPTDLDHTLFRNNMNLARRQYLTFLGVAQRDDGAPMWPTRFAGRKPYPNIVSIAQAQVFNNHSWDLWTQMWHAQLTPVDNGNGDGIILPRELAFQDWIAQMEASSGDLGEVPLLSPQVWDDAIEYFNTIEPLADQMLKH